MEELVAELGAAFLSADLALTSEVRDNHAAYISSWTSPLRDADTHPRGGDFSDRRCLPRTSDSKRRRHSIRIHSHTGRESHRSCAVLVTERAEAQLRGHV